MNIDELRSAQSKERQKSDLQQLRESFYADVASYVEDLEAEREEAAAAAEDPFGSPAVQQLTNDIETAKDTAEAIYERRLGKIVKKASLVAAEMANPNDVNGLTAEEQALFADLVERIEENKSYMLDVIAGEAAPGADGASADAGTPVETATDAAPSPVASSERERAPPESAGADDGEESSAPHPEDGFDDAPGETSDSGPGEGSDETASPDRDVESTELDGEASTGSVSAADLMGGDDPATGDADRSTTDRDGESEGERVREDGGSVAAGDDSTADAETAGGSTTAASAAETERATLRVTQDVGSILGVDEREYTLAAEDVVTLPAENADVLVEQDAAERLD